MQDVSIFLSGLHQGDNLRLQNSDLDFHVCFITDPESRVNFHTISACHQSSQSHSQISCWNRQYAQKIIKCVILNFQKTVLSKDHIGAFTKCPHQKNLCSLHLSYLNAHTQHPPPPHQKKRTHTSHHFKVPCKVLTGLQHAACTYQVTSCRQGEGAHIILHLLCIDANHVLYLYHANPSPLCILIGKNYVLKKPTYFSAYLERQSLNIWTIVSMLS